MNNDDTTRRTEVEPSDIVKPHVTLARVPRFAWVVLRADCLAQRTPFGPEGIFLSQRLNFKSMDSLSALGPSDPGPMYIRKFRILPIFSASAWSKFNIVVVNVDITLQVHTEVPTIRAASEYHLRQLALVSQLKIATMAFQLTLDIQIFRSIPWGEDKGSLSISRYANIVVCSA